MLVWQRDLVIRFAFSSIADQVGQSMSILNGSWHFDRPRDVVVSVAKLESQHLDLFLGVLNCVVDHVVVSWRDHTLSRLLRHQEKVVSVWVHNTRVDNCAWGRVAESLRILVIEESLSNSLVDQNHHHFDFVPSVVLELLDGLSDLRDLMR